MNASSSYDENTIAEWDYMWGPRLVRGGRMYFGMCSAIYFLTLVHLQTFYSYGEFFLRDIEEYDYPFIELTVHFMLVFSVLKHNIFTQVQQRDMYLAGIEVVYPVVFTYLRITFYQEMFLSILKNDIKH